MDSAFPITLSLLLACVTFLYLGAWLRLRTVFPHLVSLARAASFLVGVLLVWVAVGSPFAQLDHQLLSVHMIQHLLVMTLAAPLLLLGAPAPLLLRSLPASLFQKAAGRSLGQVSLRLPGKIFADSTFCWLAGTATVIVWHVPALFELGLHAAWWHAIEHASFFLGGLLFWWPVIRPWPSISRGPRWSVPLYLFLATLPCDALSAYLVFCDHVVYQQYLAARHLLGVSALQDQQWAGSLMWISVTFIYLVPAVVVIFQLLSGASRRAPVPDATVSRTNPPTTA